MSTYYDSLWPYQRRSKPLFNFLYSRRKRPLSIIKLTQLIKNHPPFMHRLNLMKKLKVHEGCVNTVCWNKTGQYILSGSDDHNLCITKPEYMFDTSKNYTVVHKVQTQHFGNIFAAQFMPNTADCLIVSCSSEGPILLHDVHASVPSESVSCYNCHTSTIYEVLPVPDHDKVFLSCSEDKTVRLFDIRVHNKCARADTCPHPALIRNSDAISTMALHPLNSNLLLVGRADGKALVYDRRKLPDVAKWSRARAHQERLAGASQPAFEFRHPLEGVVSRLTVPDMSERYRFTSLCYNANGSEVLASYSGDYVYLFNCDGNCNFELISTLPKTSNSDPSKAEGENKKIGVRNKSRVRVRLRGDWSDTGINSSPQTRRLLPDLTPHLIAQYALNQQNINSSQANDQNTNTNEDTQRPSLDGNDGRNNDDNEERDPRDAEREAEDDNEDNNADNMFANFVKISNVSEMFPPLSGDNSSVDSEMDLADYPKAPSVRNDTDSENDELKFKHNRTKDGPSEASQSLIKFELALNKLKERYGPIKTLAPRVKYQGHRNSRTSIKEATFWGDNYILSGSDCGRIFVWEKESAQLIMCFPADNRVVNCLAPNPHYYALASSGIDYDIKLWSTQSILDEPLRVSENEMNKIVENNEIMLEESKQTGSIPPHLFFRVVTSLRQINRARDS